MSSNDMGEGGKGGLKSVKQVSHVSFISSKTISWNNKTCSPT
jgi:hypothetical protein